VLYYTCLLHRSNNLPWNNLIALIYYWLEIPSFVGIERRRGYTSPYEISALFPNNIKRSLYPIVDGFQKSRTELNRKWSASVLHVLTRTYATRIFIHLYCRSIPNNFYNLPYEFQLSNTYDIEHLCILYIFGNHDWSRNSYNYSHCLSPYFNSKHALGQIRYGFYILSTR
jgi:hypothetical protein